MKKRLIKEKLPERLLVLLVFVLVTAWAMTAGNPGGPDEPMRYDVAKYLYHHSGELPRGDDPEIRNSTWGISYGFYPILSYMVSAVFMWIAGIFSTSEEVLLHAARMADVLFLTAAAWMTIQTGKNLFDKEKRWMFSIMVCFLPGFLFLGTYVNTDSLGLMAASMIFLAWSRYLKEGWTWKNCVLLAVGMGICFLSYFNAYGWILWSFLFFCATVLLCSGEPWRDRVKFLFSRGIAIAGITLGISGWWFIRNYLIYDGDFLGRKTCRLCAEKYAEKAYKPSVYATPTVRGWSIKDMLIYQDPGWPHNWTIMMMVSFVGTFGLFDIFMDETVSKIYVLFLVLGMIGVLFMLEEFCWKERIVTVSRQNLENGERLIIKKIRSTGMWSKKGVFHLAMLGAMITPVILLVNYSYTNDLQCQGRYVMPAVFPVMYFVTCGYGKLLERLVKKEAVRVWFYRIVSVLWIAGAVLTYFLTIVPAYQ